MFLLLTQGRYFRACAFPPIVVTGRECTSVATLLVTSYLNFAKSRQIATDLQSETDKALVYPGDASGDALGAYPRSTTVGDIGDISVIDKLAGIIEGLLAKTETQPKVSIGDKLLLTLPEVQTLTGLSKTLLRDAINKGQLKAKIIGKSWRIKRSDLDEYIANL